MTNPSDPQFDFPVFERMAPTVVEAMTMLSKAISASGLEKPLAELVKLRVSQINGCEFCLQFHLNLARKYGLADEKIDALAEWRSADLYSSRERAALAWAESLTLMAQGPRAVRVYSNLKSEFSDSEVAFLTAAIAQINTWNRIAGGLDFPPLPLDRANG